MVSIDVLWDLRYSEQRDSSEQSVLIDVSSSVLNDHRDQICTVRRSAFASGLCLFGDTKAA